MTTAPIGGMAAEPCRLTADGWCAEHSTSEGPAYCTPRQPDWDSPTWGKPGSNVHHSAWAADGRHDDTTEDC